MNKPFITDEDSALAEAIEQHLENFGPGTIKVFRYKPISPEGWCIKCRVVAEMPSKEVQTQFAVLITANEKTKEITIHAISFKRHRYVRELCHEYLESVLSEKPEGDTFIGSYRADKNFDTRYLTAGGFVYNMNRKMVLSTSESQDFGNHFGQCSATGIFEALLHETNLKKRSSQKSMKDGVLFLNHLCTLPTTIQALEQLIGTGLTQQQRFAFKKMKEFQKKK